MAIYRGVGGSGDATGDAANQAVIALKKASEAAASAAAASLSQLAAQGAATQAAASAASAEAVSSNVTGYVTEAETAAGIATTAASSAASSQAISEFKAGAAEASATAAAASASSASTSATNAAAAASAASANATTASTAATNAANSASNAATSASNASTSASNASTYASTANTAASNAASSATSAAGSASTATTQAGIATTKASNANTYASNASSSASAAAASATAAATSATNASNSASTASTQAANATSSASAAAASAASAAALLDNFDDRYLGDKTSDPTLDNDGNALLIGALYFNTTTKKMRVYTSTGWVDGSSSGQASLIVYKYVATAGQTSFSGADSNGATLSYLPTGVIISLNGVILDSTDYTASSGTSVVLSTAALVGDVLTVYAFNSFNIASIDGSAIINGTITTNKFAVAMATAADVAAKQDADTELTTLAGMSSGRAAFLASNANFSFRNRLINPTGIVNQRNYVSGAATSGANQYTVDRWRVVTSTQNLSWTTSGIDAIFTAPAGGVEQVIEGNNLETGTYVLSWTGTATATVNGSSVANGGTIALTGGVNAIVRFTGGTFSLPQLEIGTVPTAFERRFYSTELQLCQRYYYRVFPAAVSMSLGAVGWANLATSAVVQGAFPVPMRIAPTALEQSGTASNYAVTGAAGATNCSAVPTFGSATTNLHWNITMTVSTGLTVGQAVTARTGSSTGAAGYLGWSAEL